jgi:CheY-like chemotaxis protein
VRADAGQLEQMLLNLVVNARDAMPRGGRLSLHTANVSLDQPSRLTTGVLPAGSYVELTVTDTGTGMPPEVLAHIFEPFFTTKPTGEGTGLGLATVYGVVTQSGGGIAVTTEVGAGTTFRLYLPRVDDVPQAIAAADDRGPMPNGTETVLVVEDDPPVRTFIARVLRQRGYTVFEAGRAEEALRRLGDDGQPIHLLVTDAVLPGVSGRGVSEQAALLRQGIRILFVSGHTEAMLARRGIVLGGAPLLAKPFTAAALAHKVRDVLDGRSEIVS